MQMYQDFPRKTSHQLIPQAISYISKPTFICNFLASGSICDDLKLGYKLHFNCYPSSLLQGWWSTNGQMMFQCY